MSKSSKHGGASGFMAENMLLLGVLFILLGLFFGSCVLSYNVSFLLAVVPLAVGVLLVVFAWLTRLKTSPMDRKPRDGSE